MAAEKLIVPQTGLTGFSALKFLLGEIISPLHNASTYELFLLFLRTLHRQL